MREPLCILSSFHHVSFCSLVKSKSNAKPKRTEQNFTERAGHKWFNICMQHAPIMPICSQIKLNIIVTFIRILFAMLSNHNASLNTFAAVQIFNWNDKSIRCSTNYRNCLTLLPNSHICLFAIFKIDVKFQLWTKDDTQISFWQIILCRIDFIIWEKQT